MSNIVITGANRGIGLSLATQFSQAGHNVAALCRQSSSELDHLDVTVIEGADVGSISAIESSAKQVPFEEVDLLINNAGILRNEVLGSIDYESIQSQFSVNTLGPLKVTESLQQRFKNGSKVVMITSRMGSIEDNTSGGRYGYRMSKAALNIAAVSLAHDLRSLGVSVGIIHPGLVGTDMIGGFGDITPDQAAERIIQRIEELNMSNSGTFWHSNGEELPW